MSSSPPRTRSRSLQNNNNNNILSSSGDDDGQSDKSTKAAVAATSRNNYGGKDRKINNKQQHGIHDVNGGNQSTRRSGRLEKKQTVEYVTNNNDDDDDDESDGEDDESDEEDDESDFEDGGGTTKTSRRGRATNKTDGNNQKKKRTYTKKKPLVTTTYKYPDDQFHISGWKTGKLPTPEEILERTQFYYERKMNEHENYSNAKVWSKFVEDGKAKGLFPKSWSVCRAKKWYNQSKAVAKGDLPDQPFPNFESIEQIIEARVYSHYTGAALRKTFNDLYEYGRQNGSQGRIMVPRQAKGFHSEAYEKLGKLAGEGNEKAIKAYNFVHAVEALRQSSRYFNEHYAKSLVELLENDGIVLFDDNDEGNYSAHERRNQQHCHETFLRFALGDESNDITLRRKINLTRDPIESKEKILEREEEKYFVHSNVAGICVMRQIEFCQDVAKNAGGVGAIEEMHRNNLLSTSSTNGRGWMEYVDKYHPEHICEKCGLKMVTCGSLQHKGAGAIRIKKQRGGMTPKHCTLEELEAQDKLMRKCGDGSRFEYLCLGCHRVDDLSTIARIAFGDIDVRSIEAGSYRHSVERVMRYKTIMTARCEDHRLDPWTNEPLQPINSPRDDAHHSSARYHTALYDRETGEMFALDTAKREYEKVNSTGLLGGDSMDDFIDRNARHLAVTVSMDANRHNFLHIIIGLVERGQLNCGVLPFECRGSYYIVPVGEDENRDLYDILTEYKSWFEKIDAKKVLACPRVSLRSGNILEDVIMGDACAEVENVAKDGDVGDSTTNFDVEDDKVPANSQLAVGYGKLGKCPLAPIKERVQQQQYHYDNGHGALDGQNLFEHIHLATTEDFRDMNVEDGEEFEAYRHLHLSLKESDEQYGELERELAAKEIEHNLAIKEKDSMLAAKEIEHNLAIETMEAKLSAIIAENEEMKTMLSATINEKDAIIAAHEETIDRRDATINDLSSLTKQMEKLTCESREKDEKIATMQVDHKTVVAELTEEHRVENETMNKEMSDLREEFADRVAALETANAVAILAKNEEMSDLREDFADRVAALEADHTKELSKKNEEMSDLREEFADRVAALEADHAREVSTKDEEMAALEAAHAREMSTKDEEMAALEAAHAATIATKDEEMASLTEQMETMKIEHDQTVESMEAEHNTHVAELTEAHRVEKETMKIEHDQTVESMEAEHNTHVAELTEAHRVEKETMKIEHDQTVESMEAEHNTHVAELTEAHRVEKETMKIEHDQTVESMEAEHNTHVAELTEAHRVEKETMKIEHDQTVESMEAEHNTHVAELTEAHRVEKETMKREHDQTVKSMQVEHENLENAVYFYEQRNKNLQNKTIMLMEEVDISASDLEVARGRISELENDNIVLMEDVDVSASELAAARGRISELENDNSNLRAKLDETEETLSKLQSSRVVQFMSMTGLCDPPPNKKRRVSES